MVDGEQDKINGRGSLNRQNMNIPSHPTRVLEKRKVNKKLKSLGSKRQ